MSRGGPHPSPVCTDTTTDEDRQPIMVECISNIPSDTWKNMTWCVLRNLMLIHTHPGPVESERFSECLREIKARKITHLLSVAKGAAEIDSVQRKAASEAVAGLQIVAIMDNALTRGFITALGWLGVNIKSYPPDQLDRAIARLDIPGLTGREIQAALDELGERSRPRHPASPSVTRSVRPA
jgi:hypothetical protein